MRLQECVRWGWGFSLTNGVHLLARIDLRFNQIVHVPTLTAAPTLKEILLGSNKIIELEDMCFAPEGVNVLDLRDNKIFIVPPSIQRLKHLERLDLTNNNASRLFCTTPASHIYCRYPNHRPR